MILLSVMPNFAEKVEFAVDALSGQRDVNENEFIDAAQYVYDGVREIRRTVLMNRVRFFNAQIFEDYTNL